jgi:hypothetical protein
VPPLDFGNSLKSPLFRKVVEACIELFPAATGKTGKAGTPDFQGVSWALHNALCATGAPFAVERGFARPSAPEKASAAIAKAMLAREVELIHLCPLDQADEWPG